MNKLLIVAAITEAATGLALILNPPMVTWLLLGKEASGLAIVVAHVAGIGLLSLGLACWPGKETNRPARCAMLTYNLLATLYLSYLGIRGDWVGRLLWPAVVLHAVLTLLLARAWFGARTPLVK